MRQGFCGGHPRTAAVDVVAAACSTTACRRRGDGCLSCLAVIPRSPCAAGCSSRGSSNRSWCPAGRTEPVAWFHCGRVSRGKNMRRRSDVPNLEDPLPARTSPDAEDVLAVPHAKDGSADLLAGLAELVADHGEQQVLPVAVGHALSQAHHPLPAVLVLLVLPYWTDSLLEEMVVRYQRQR